jgi:hypothetical protein
VADEAGSQTFRFVGSIEVGPVAPRAAAPLAAVPPSFSVSGTLRTARYGYPLSGLEVSAWFVEPEDPAHAAKPAAQRSETALGTAVSGPDGNFQITFLGTPAVKQKLCLLAQCEGAYVRLVVRQDPCGVLYRSEPLAPRAGAVVADLDVELPAVPVGRERWIVIGERLERARIGQLHLLAKQLAAPQAETLFADWGPELRQAALAELEQAFLDPTYTLRALAGPLPSWKELRAPGALDEFVQRLQPHLENAEARGAVVDLAAKVHSFDDLRSVDWQMDLNEFRDGNVVAAVSKYAETYRAGVVAEALFPRLETDLTRYRDYLREIWPAWATKVVYIQPHQLTPQQALDQLRNRFHQNFFTHDTALRSANEVLIPILTEILTAPPGNTWGFGIAPAGIPPRGTQTPRQYLDALIGLTGLSPTELGLRYRLDLTRPDSALSSPVQENIATLQAFYRDSFQCAPDPAPTAPDVHFGRPMVSEKLQGKAPFFLHYDEWLRQQSPFYPENFFDVRRTYSVDVVDGANGRDLLKTRIQNSGGQERAEWQFIWNVWDISDKLNEGHAQYYRGEYGDALQKYLAAFRMAFVAIQEKLVKGFDIAGALAGRKKLPVNNMQELSKFLKPPPFGLSFEYNLRPYDRDDMILALVYYCLYTIPVCLGDTYLALGDYEKSVFHYGQTTRFPVGTARETDTGGYRPHYLKDFPLYHIGDRPYTVNLGTYREYPLEGDSGEYYDTTTYSQIEQLRVDLIAKYAHPVEVKYFRLRQANAMLEWADALYRTNDAPSIQRARELYKGVSFLHGEMPPLCPTWPSDWRFGLGPVAMPLFRNHRENPAVVLQKVRARKGLFQIDAGLNYYGDTDQLVPPLRYRPLKETADRFAALAKSAQQDFLLYMEKMESALLERMKLANLLQKASLQAKVAEEQGKVAEYNVVVAQEQVANVQAQIAAKEKEIADSESFFSQLGDFIGGMVKTFTSLPGDTQSAVKAGFVAEVTGKELVGQGMLGLGAGASIMAGFGIFAVAGYMSMSSMADASNRRAAELRTLREKALPLAEGLVRARQREVTIAGYQRQIAQADIALARDLIQFEDNRFLNLNFWANLAQVAKRVLRRYVELGTRVAWLAERALAYEQDRPISVIRLDYFSEKMQGVTGADLLQADLAELEATRVEGIKRSVPVKHTFSLVRDFPLAFGQLKQTGRCSFKTEEVPFRLAYPGTAGYRIRAVSLAVTQTSLISPLRGLLINQGVSVSRPGQPGEHVLVRPAEALPISEFKLQNDMAVYSLPDETLLTFEGSAVETFWEIHLPAPANASGYDGIADVLFTLDLWAQYSPDLYAKDVAAMPKTVRRWVVISGKQYQPGAIQDLAGVANPVTIPFDLKTLKLPSREAKRKLKNIAIFFVSPSPLDVDAKLLTETPAVSVNLQFQKGIAMSNLPPTASDPVPPPMPLNALADFAADQRFSLAIDKTQNPAVDFSQVSDVVLAVEYAADLT